MICLCINYVQEQKVLCLIPCHNLQYFSNPIYLACVVSHPSLLNHFHFRSFFFSLTVQNLGGAMACLINEMLHPPWASTPWVPRLDFHLLSIANGPLIHPLMCDPFFISIQTVYNPSIPTLNFNKLINTFVSAFKIIRYFSSRAWWHNKLSSL